MFTDKVLEDNSLKVFEDGFEVTVRLLWYRSLPLSCVEKVRLAVDGEEVDPKDIRFGFEDALYPLDVLEEMTDKYWYMQDSARIFVDKPEMISKGKDYQIEAEVVMRVPYISIGPGKFLKLPHKVSAVQTAS